MTKDAGAKRSYGMLKIRWPYLVLLSLFAGQAMSASPRQAPPPVQDRVPNKDPFQLYPRWTTTRVDFPSMGGHAVEMAIDEAGVAHVIVCVPGFPIEHIYYSNNRPDSRTKNGFKAPIFLADAFCTSGDHPSDIAVSRDGQVAVAYFAQQGLLVRRLNPTTGQWGAAQLVSDAYAFTDAQGFHQKFQMGPAVAYDSTNRLHLVFVEEKQDPAPGTQTGVRIERTVLYSLDLGALETIASGFTTTFAVADMPSTVGNARQGAPVVEPDPAGIPHVSWRHTLNDQQKIRYSVRGTGGWAAPTNVSDSPLASSLFDMAVDEAGDVHVVYAGNPKSFYKKKPASGTFGNEEQLPTLGNPKVAVDSRRKPNVLLSSSAVTSFARKVDNSVPDVNQWALQPGLDQPDPGAFFGEVVDVFVPAGSETVHFFSTGVGTGLYGRSVEYNLGPQDSFLQAPFGPSAVANLATGNLSFELPLFSTRSGAGFSTSFSLLYNSLDPGPSLISPGWRTNYDISLVDRADNQLITVQFGDGRIIPFVAASGGLWLPPDEFGHFSAIELNQPAAGQYTMTTKFGVQYIFNSAGRLDRMVDTNSNELVLFYGDNSASEGTIENLLLEVRDSMWPSRPATRLEYDSKNRLIKVIDPGQNTYTLAYQTALPAPTAKLETVKFDGAPSPQVVIWKFEYYTANNFNRSVNPPVEEHKNLLSKLFTPKGNAQTSPYSHIFGYLLDGRIASTTEPLEDHVTDDGALLPPLQTENIQARREIAYVDPAPPFNLPNELDSGNVVPSVQIKDRRGTVTKFEFEYRRCLANRIEDELTAAQGGPGVIRRFFETRDDPISGGGTQTTPVYRNLKRFVDKEGNETLYFYTHEEGTKELPLYVKDNVRRIRQPAANSTDPSGSNGATATVDTVAYTYEDNLSRIKTAKDALENTTTYLYDTAGNLAEIIYPSVPNQGQAREIYTHDSRGRLENYTSPENVANGKQIIFQYLDGVSGLVTRISRPDHGQPEMFEYDSLTTKMGLMKKHILPLGGTTELERDDLYRLKMQTAPAGDAPSVTTFKYDEDSNLKEVDGPDGANTKHDYDDLDRLIRTTQTETASRSLITKFKYDKDGNTREIEDPRQKLTTTIYDKLGRVDQGRRPGDPAITTKYEYNLNGMEKKEELGATGTTTTYTGRGLLLVTQNTGLAAQADEREYFEDGSLKTSLHKENGVIVIETRYGYDDRRRLISTSQISDFATLTMLTTQFVLDKNSNHRQIIDPEGRSTYFEFDAADRPTIRRDHTLAFVSETIYDDNDRVDMRTGADPRPGAPPNAAVLAVDFGYNDRGDVKTETDFFGNVNTHFYDGRGNRLRSVSPPSNGESSETRVEFDLAGRVTREIHAFGTAAQSIWTYEYDENGNRTRIIDPRLFVYEFVYDDGNRLIQFRYPTVGGQTPVETWEYDDRGNLLRHTDAEGKVATVTYDTLNRPLTEAHVKNTATVADIRRGYDGKGNLAFTWDAVSKVLVAFTDSGGTPAYDSLNRLLEIAWFIEATSVSFQNGTLIHNGQFFARVVYRKADGKPGYDGSGNLTDMFDPAGHRYLYTHDVNGRLDEVRRTPSGSTTEAVIAKQLYTSSGLRREVQLLGGSRQLWEHDGESRLQLVRLVRPDGTTEAARVEYGYDARDRRERATYPLLQREATYTYDAQDRLTSETWRNTASSPPPPPCSNNPQDLTPGNYSAFTAPVCATPSAQGQIVHQSSWEYDPSGNRTKQTKDGVVTDYVYDSQNRLSSETRGATAIAYDYDLNGNQKKRVVQGASEERLKFDYMNRVEMYEKGSPGFVTGTTQFVYRYTPMGERLAKVDLVALTEESFMNDGQDVTADFSRPVGGSSFALLRTYVNGLAIDSKIARIEPGEATYFYVGDALGSVHEMIDTAGNIVRQNLYTAWGEDLPGFAGTAFTDRYSFAQREKDEESALMHFRARAYDPRIGRFIQTDPLRASRPIEHYLYAQGEPVSRTDRTGQYVELSDEEETQFGEQGKAGIVELLTAPQFGGRTESWKWSGRRLTYVGKGQSTFDALWPDIDLGGSRTRHSLSELFDIVERTADRIEENVRAEELEQARIAAGLPADAGEALFLQLHSVRRATLGTMGVSLFTGLTLLGGTTTGVVGAGAPTAGLVTGSSAAPLAATLSTAAATGTAVATSPAGQRAVQKTIEVLSSSAAQAAGPSLSTQAARAGTSGVLQSAVQQATATANRVAGVGFQSRLAAFFRSRGADVTENKYFPTPFGRRYVDLEVKTSKAVEYFEAKFGPKARYGVQQRAADLWLYLTKGIRVKLIRQK